MYPLNLTKAATVAAPAGFATANDETEHAALSAQGFVPAYVAPVQQEEPPAERDAVMAALDAAGISYDKRLGIEKLKALLPQ